MTEQDRKFWNGILKLQEVILITRGWEKVVVNKKEVLHYGM